MSIGKFWRECCPHLMLFEWRRIAPNRLAAAIKNRSRSYRVWFVWGRLAVVTESREVVPPEQTLYVRPDLGER